LIFALTVDKVSVGWTMRQIVLPVAFFTKIYILNEHTNITIFRQIVLLFRFYLGNYITIHRKPQRLQHTVQARTRFI
jgi:hypothetical protein